MNSNMFTENSILAMNEAKNLAVKYQQQVIKPEMLAYALLENKEGLIPKVLEKMGLNIHFIYQELEHELEKMPKVQGGYEQEISLSPATHRVLVEAEETMKKMEIPI